MMEVLIYTNKDSAHIRGLIEDKPQLPYNNWSNAVSRHHAHALNVLHESE